MNVRSPSPALDAALACPVPVALGGRLASFGAVRGGAARFTAEVSPFGGLPAEPGPGDWADLAALCGPGALVVLVRAGDTPPEPPAGWALERPFPGVQMEGSGLRTEPYPGAVALGPDDHAEMAELAGRTRPGPWLARTAELGGFLGVRDVAGDGRLVAMAGERMRVQAPDGSRATEISAVCTDPAWRGRGLAGALVRAVAHAVVERGELPVLHAAEDNENAIRLYRAMGFTLHRPMRFDQLRTPAAR
ncbi:GNAT family N-acetyltransferase [Pseudonocardia phyllosphaerae]|uniref:GNAT family N-acetyltransferase n=1 Tax=Pseudonocardia phyllosphaerae TaxID=3390502 RepID=UPI0039781B37